MPIHGAVTTPGDSGEKAKGAVGEGLIGTAAGFIPPALGESAKSVWNKLSPSIRQTMQRLADSGKIDEANNIIKNAISSLSGKAAPIEQKGIYQTSEELSQKGKTEAAPLYEKAFEGGSSTFQNPASGY